MCRTTGFVPKGPPGTGKGVANIVVAVARAEVGKPIGFGRLRLVLLGRVAAGAGEVDRGVGGAVGIGVFVGSAMVF